MHTLANASREIPIKLAGSGEEFEYLFRYYYRIKGPGLMAADKRWLPPADLFETQEALILIMDIAGIDRQEVSVRIEGRTLTIRGLRREISKYPKRHYYLMEVDFGPFERRFRLPRGVDADRVEVNYVDGLLEVVMPKTASGGDDDTSAEGGEQEDPDV
ncbi:MAG: Hsp20/alpha crystallin family protein [bacterium]